MEAHKQMLIERIKASSLFASRFIAREPLSFEAMLNRLDSPFTPDYLKTLSEKAKGLDEAALGVCLRQFRMAAQVELICRDLAGVITVPEMLVALSDLASACIEVAYRYLYAEMARRHGVPCDAKGNAQHLVIFGMGKLGGGELNFSSDIDLILAYPHKGETAGNADGDKVIDNELFFHRLAQKLIKLLDNIDEYGFVYRVDMRLKPFGSVGTLCTTFEAMQRYYLTHGRNWERYALVKMRPVAGDIEAGQQLLELLSPFVYQRHVDYEAVASIEEMKVKIISNTQEKSLKDNLKLGQGGIREIEFLVQTFQMIYGGRMRALRGQSLLKSLSALMGKELLSSKMGNMLRDNYLFLRKVENAIQYYDDQQSHDLPNKTESRRALLSALGFEQWLDLVEEISRVRFEVSQLFTRVFATQTGEKEAVDPQKLTEEYWLDLLYQTDLTKESAEKIANSFVQFYQRMKNHDLGERYLIRLNWVLPKVIEALDGEENPVKIAKHMLDLLEAIVDESVYLSLLVEHPAVLKKIMHLFMHSDWMTQFLCAHPLVIDELIHENHEESTPDAKAIRNALSLTISQCIEPEATVQKLIDFKNAMMFRTASADLQNKIRLMHVSDQLTWTAEAIIDAVLQLCLQEMYEKYGKPRYIEKGETKTAHFGVIAYGKLGGLEMGYGSDLDLVYLHSSQGEAQMTDGARSIENDVFFTRLAAKFTQTMTTLGSSGKLYQIDNRLRPSGQSGLSVHSLSAFAHYQLHDAWTWEHQALVRARFIAGGEDIETGFAQIREATIAKPRDIVQLRNDVLNMRQKMRDASREAPAGFVHVKHGLGGVTDIEFIVQYLLLRHSKQYPLLIRCSDNMRQLSALELFDVLRSADASDLRSAYRQFRLWIHHCQLLGKRAVAPSQQFASQMDVVKRIWDKVFVL